MVDGMYTCTYAPWMPGKEYKHRDVSFHSKTHFYVVYGVEALNSVILVSEHIA